MKEKILDYSEVGWKMDKFLPDDGEVYELFDEAMEGGELEDVIDFLNEFANDRIYEYLPEGGTIEGFAKYLKC
jgi:hypothetical protein